MKLFWVSGCFFLLVALKCINGSSFRREKRQQQLTFGVRRVPPNKETFLFLNNEQAVSLNNVEQRRILQGSVTCNFDTSTFLTRIGTSDTNFNPVRTCYDVTGSGLMTYTTGSNTFGENGKVYIDQNSLVYIDNSVAGFINFVDQSIATAPPVIEPISVLVVERSEQLVLNVDDSNAINDSVADLADDILVLTRSTCRQIPIGSSAVCNMGTLTVFNGPAIDSSIGNLDECYVIRNVDNCPLFSRLDNTMVSATVTGPAVVCDGVGQTGGQSVGFISNNETINNMIQMSLINQQMQFVNVMSADTGELVSTRINGRLGTLSGQTIFDITGGDTQSFTFSNADRISYMNDAVTISDRFNNVIRQFGSAGNSATLGFYSNTMLTSTTSGGMFSSSVAPGRGLQTYVTGGASTTPMVFAYPAGVDSLTNRIESARSALPQPPRTPPSYGVRSNSFGEVILLANNQPIQTVSTAMSIPIERTECIRYNMDTVSVYKNCDTSQNPTNEISNITTLNFDDVASNRLLTFMGSAPSPIQGPGRFYFSGNSGTIIGRPELEQLITNVESITRPAININRRITTMGNPVASIVSGNTNLFTFNVMDVSTINVGGDNMVGDNGIVYRNNMVGTTRIVQVPDEATVQFTTNSAIIRENRRPNRTVSIVGPVSTPEFPGSSTFVEVMPTDILPGGGTIYRGTMGTVYIPDGRVTDAAYNMIRSVNAITEDFPSTSLNFYDGRVIRMFSGSADMVLPGPGTVYSNSGNGQSFFSTVTSFNNRIPSTVSQLVPLGTTYDSTTGNINITTPGGMRVTEISISSETSTIPFNGSATALSGNITIFDQNGNTVREVSGINSVTILDGVSTMTVTTSGTTVMMLPSTGTLYFDMINGRGVQITERTVANQIARTITSVSNTFTVPNVVRPSVPEVISNTDVTVIAGTTVRVPVGSIVTLTCEAGNANPPAQFMFTQRDSTTNNTFVPIPMQNIVGESGVTNRVTIMIRAQPGSTDYRCVARNILGQTSTISTVRGEPGRSPEIRNDFFTGGTTPGTIAVTARTDNPTSMPIIDTSTADDRSQISNRAIIGCRAKGRPTPTITWTRTPINPLDMDDSMVFIDDTIPGQSRLITNLTVDDVQCFTYTCNASNALGFALATREICPRRYEEIAGSGVMGDCSASCGIGVRLITFEYNLITAMGTTRIAFNDLPEGLVKPTVRFCSDVACPEMLPPVFRAGPFSECTKYCARGFQSRTVECVVTTVGIVNSTVVDDKLCFDRGLVRPSVTESCNDIPCPRYNITSTTPCTRSCRGGTITRTIECIEVDEFGMFGTTEMETCTNFSLEARPPDTISCNDNIRCPVQYLTVPVGPCDEFFCQRLNNTCVQNDEPELWPVADEICQDQGLVPGPPVTSCGGNVCNFGIWRDVPLLGATCSAECGPGVQNYAVFCEDGNTGVIIDDRFCNGNLRPASTRPCFVRNCPGVCEFEPPACAAIAVFNACKRMDIEMFANIIPSCCKSCPGQATPIPLL